MRWTEALYCEQTESKGAASCHSGSHAAGTFCCLDYTLATISEDEAILSGERHMNISNSVLSAAVPLIATKQAAVLTFGLPTSRRHPNLSGVAQPHRHRNLREVEPTRLASRFTHFHPFVVKRQRRMERDSGKDPHDQ